MKSYVIWLLYYGYFQDKVFIHAVVYIGTLILFMAEYFTLWMDYILLIACRLYQLLAVSIFWLLETLLS